jgi:signal transduction histidine kinase
MRKRDCTLAPDAAMQRSGEVMDLRSMREKAEMRDGSLGVDSSPGAGTRVELRVPLDRQLQGLSEGSS